MISVSTVEENAERRVRMAKKFYREEGLEEGRAEGASPGNGSHHGPCFPSCGRWAKGISFSWKITESSGFSCRNTPSQLAGVKGDVGSFGSPRLLRLRGLTKVSPTAGWSGTGWSISPA